MMWKARVVLAIMVACGLTAGMKAEDPPDTFLLTVEELIRRECCLVVRLTMDAPPSENAEITRLAWAYGEVPKEAEFNVGNGIWRRNEERRRAEVLLVAQSTPGSEALPPTIMLSTQQASNGTPGAATSEAHRLQTGTKLEDVLKIDVHTGSYPLNTPVKIGTLGGADILLSVEPDRADE